VCIVVALAVVMSISRLLGLSRELGALIAVGTSICGVTAIAATAPLIRAREVEVSYATACISLFGMMALIVYPGVAYFIFGDQLRLAGIFLGTAVHDTAQVAGAALMYEEQFNASGTLEAATVTKLLRNLCMAVVIPFVAILYRNPRRAADPLAGKAPPLVPVFVLGFIALCAVRTVSDLGERPFGLLSPEDWMAFVQGTQYASEWALTLAMAAIGLQTRFVAFRSLGWRPLALGLFAALLVGLVSAGTLLLMSTAGA
jgi:uncharacterized integral membrane protein (TIGR00698 family)